MTLLYIFILDNFPNFPKQARASIQALRDFDINNDKILEPTNATAEDSLLVQSAERVPCNYTLT